MYFGHGEFVRSSRSAHKLLAGHRRVGLTGEGLRAGEEMRAYVREALRRRSSVDAHNDLLSVLAGAYAAGSLAEDEAVGGAMLLFVAGISTTSALISSSFLHLHRFDDQLRLLRRSPDLIPQAVEELLRFDAPFQWFTRVAARDAAIHGVPIPAGGRVVLVWGSANRAGGRNPTSSYSAASANATSSSAKASITAWVRSSREWRHGSCSNRSCRSSPTINHRSHQAQVHAQRTHPRPIPVAVRWQQ